MIKWLKLTLIVILILLLSYLLLWPKICPGITVESVKVKITFSDLSNIDLALQSFETDCKRFPTNKEGLKALLITPANTADWRGPYLTGGPCLASEPIDPWKNPYKYSTPGTSENKGCTIWSMGPDGKNGTADDIHYPIKFKEPINKQEIPQEPKTNWFLDNLLINIFSFICGIGLTFVCRFITQRYWQKQFKAIFGNDVVNPNGIYLAYSEFVFPSLIYDDSGKEIKWPYRKSIPVIPVSNELPNAFSISNPVSIAEIRAANYLSTLIGKYVKQPVFITSDIQIKDKVNLSFISFGGPGNNHKTNDIIINESNQLIHFDGFRQMTSVTSKKLILDKNVLINNYDYGLILKIRPNQYPNRTWIMCAGFGEWGTSGAAYYLANNWKDIYKWAKNSNFAIIIKVRHGQDESAEKWKRVLTIEEVEALTK